MNVFYFTQGHKMVTFEGGVGQAVHWAFNVRRETPQSAWLAIERMIKRKGDAEKAAAQAERAVSFSRINLNGLSKQEKQVQAVLIQCAIDSLQDSYRAAMWARNVQHPLEKTTAINELLHYLPKICDNDDVQTLLVLSSYGQKRGETTNNAIKKVYGVHDRVLHENRQVIKNAIHSIETAAYGSLEAQFKCCGLID